VETVTKTILITGAGTGIGRDSAIALAARGHRVIATTYSMDEAEQLSTESAGKIETFKLDITDAADRAIIAELDLDVLINNAAIGDSGSLAEVDIDRVRRTFEVNVFATLEISQIAIRKMIEKKSGTLLFISSVAGRIPIPFLMPYSMTKFALSAAAAGLREEMDTLGKGINVSVIEPGAFHTGFNQSMLGKKYEWMEKQSFFSPEQIARLKKRESKEFKMLEEKTTRAIVNKIVQAAEADRPWLRYVAPWLQGFGVRMMRIFGK
tara:strand:- start:123153 stop:123947 length:795 start_codon:yes stop_codon:yes gene_type:complete